MTSTTGTGLAAVEGKQIYSLLPRIMEDLGAIGKSRKNTGKGYKFRGIEDVLNHLHPVLVKHGVSISQRSKNLRTETIEESGVQGGPSKQKRIFRSFLEMDVAFHAPDGSSVVNTAAGEGIDYNDDKATSKAMSAAFKYAVFFGLCVPVEDGDLVDSDGSSNGPPISQGAVMISSPGVDAANAAVSAEIAATANGTAVANGTSLDASRSFQPESISDNSPSQKEQRERIIALASRIGEAMNWQHENSVAWLKATISKKGKQKVADLTYSEAASLIGFLEAKLTKAEAEMLFGNPNEAAETVTQN